MVKAGEFFERTSKAANKNDKVRRMTLGDSLQTCVDPSKGPFKADNFT